eukprot:15463962-Alexandrium_andersonii.AAC.1
MGVTRHRRVFRKLSQSCSTPRFSPAGPSTERNQTCAGNFRTPRPYRARTRTRLGITLRR